MIENPKKPKGTPSIEHAPANVSGAIKLMLKALSGDSETWMLDPSRSKSNPYTKAELDNRLHIYQDDSMDTLVGLGILEKEVPHQRVSIMHGVVTNTYVINIEKLKKLRDGNLKL